MERCINFLKKLVNVESITPDGYDAIKICEEFLSNIGFECEIIKLEEIYNLYAHYNSTAVNNICFAGHIDVVPAGTGWTYPPFNLIEQNGKLYGRGTNDMKGPLSAAFMAIFDFIKNKNFDFGISVILTSDEEIMGDFGTKKVVEQLKKKGQTFKNIILCESCSPSNSGEYIKIGSRGSLDITFESTGIQCHVVSTKKIGNHIHEFIKFLNIFMELKFDEGNTNFCPTNFEITSIDTNNEVRNVVPGHITAKANIRFNDIWTHDSLEKFIKSKTPHNINLNFHRNAAPFLGCSRIIAEQLQKIIQKIINIKPEIGTSGGNSDAVFLKELGDVVEIGSPINIAHTADEYIAIADLKKLKAIYYEILSKFEIL